MHYVLCRTVAQARTYVRTEQLQPYRIVVTTVGLHTRYFGPDDVIHLLPDFDALPNSRAILEVLDRVGQRSHYAPTWVRPAREEPT